MADNPFPILPQYQGDYYDLQRKQALAQALQGMAMQPMQADESGWNQMRMVPRASPLASVAKLGQALLGGYEGNQAVQAQRQLGQEQWQGIQSMMGGGPPQGSGLQQGNNTSQSGAPMPQGAQSSAQGQPGQSGPQPAMRSPLNPAGLPPSAAAMMYYTNPSDYNKNLVAPYYAPTDATKMALQSGSDPVAANADALRKANNIAPIEGRAGGYTGTPYVGQDGQIHYSMQYNQPIPQGGQPLYDANGRVAGTQALPGAAGVEGAMAGAKAAGAAAGQAPYNVMSGFDPSTGAPVYTTQGNILGMGGQGGPQGGSFPGYRSPNQQGPQNPPGVAPGLPAGTNDMIKGFVTRNQAVMDAASTAQRDIQALQEINRLSQQAPTGVGLERKGYIESLANAIPGVNINSTDKDVYDQISKYVAQSAARNGGRSDAALENAIHSTTNGEMSPQAIGQLTPNLIGLKMADIGNANARQNWLQSHGNSPMSLQKYEQVWNTSYNPDVYRLQAMPPQQQAQFVRSLSPQQAQALMQSRQALKQLGGLPNLSQVP
jgi:hypothetical protein